MTDFVRRWWSVFTASRSGTWSDGAAGDGRELAVLQYVLEKAEKNPESVLQTIDQYGVKSFLMTIGDQKGPILVDAMTSTKAKNVLEIGAYVGYSATLLGSKLPDGGKLVSVDKSSENADITRQVTNHAGLSEKVVVLAGILGDKVEELKEMLSARGVEKFDFVFIDHHGPCYLPDFLILKEKGLIGKGTVVFADNMTLPGSPDYRDYILSHPDEYPTEEHQSRIPRLGKDSVFVTTCA